MFDGRIEVNVGPKQCVGWRGKWIGASSLCKTVGLTLLVVVIVNVSG